jgi:hypothetical protein
MKVIDKILNEWSFRCHDGIVDMNDPKKKAILEEISKEYNVDLNLIDEVEEETSNEVIKPTTTDEDVNKLSKIFDSIKEDYSKYLAVFSLFDPNSLGTISEVLLAKLIENKGIETTHTGGSQGLTDIIINGHNISLKTSGSKNKIGLGNSSELTNPRDSIEIANTIKELVKTNPNISKLTVGELKDVLSEADWNKINGRLKAIAQKLSGEGNKEFFVWIEKIINKDTKIIEALNIHVIKYDYDKTMNTFYNGYLRPSGKSGWGIENDKGIIIQADADQKLLNVTPTFVRNSSSTSPIPIKLSKPNLPKIDITKLITSKLFTSLDSIYKDIFPSSNKVDEGAKVDFEDGTVTNIEMSTKPIKGEQLITVNGIRTTNNYKIYYSLESNPEAEHIKASQDALKYDSDKINVNELKNLIIQTLKGKVNKVDYIGFLESKGGLNNLLLNIIKDIYNVPDENIIYVKKVEYNYIDNAVDWEQFQKESKTIQNAILKYLEKTSEKPGPYKIRKSGETQSAIIQRLHSKYDLGLNPNESNKDLPPIFNVIVDCLNNNKTLLIIDDNIHTGIDFSKIFKSINQIIEKMKEESLKPSDEELNSSSQIQNIVGNPKFKTSIFLQNKYKELKQIENQFQERKLIINKQYSNSTNNIFGYVLYKLKDSDL